MIPPNGRLPPWKSKNSINPQYLSFIKFGFDDMMYFKKNLRSLAYTHFMTIRFRGIDIRYGEGEAEGGLTDVPAVLGDSVKALTDTRHLLMDPEVYEGGRLFALEGAAFQDVLVLTDYLSESWDQSVVQGFRAYAGCRAGLCVGETRQADWEAVLGAPDSRVTIDPERAEYSRVDPGTCDYYRLDGCQLQLYADEEGVLRLEPLTVPREAAGQTGTGTIDCIALHNTYGDTEYITRIYVYDGSLREWFGDEGAAFRLSAGEIVCPVDEMKVTFENGLLQADLRSGQEWSRVYLSMRTPQETSGLS